VSLLEKLHPHDPRPSAPPERPRGIAPARLNGRPGVGADVLRELKAFAARDESRTARRKPVPPPTPRTDEDFAAALAGWQAEIAKIETGTIAALAALDARITKALDAEYNADVFAVHHLTTPVLEQLRDMRREMAGAAS
jgi:hypothetical protein